VDKYSALKLRPNKPINHKYNFKVHCRWENSSWYKKQMLRW